jgi:hypothetical protein
MLWRLADLHLSVKRRDILRTLPTSLGPLRDLANATKNFVKNSYKVQGGSNMTGTDLCINKSQFVPVIFEPPCTSRIQNKNLIKMKISIINQMLIIARDSVVSIATRDGLGAQRIESQ